MLFEKKCSESCIYSPLPKEIPQWSNRKVRVRNQLCLCLTNIFNLNNSVNLCQVLFSVAICSPNDSQCPLHLKSSIVSLTWGMLQCIRTPKWHRHMYTRVATIRRIPPRFNALLSDDANTFLLKWQLSRLGSHCLNICLVCVLTSRD